MDHHNRMAHLHGMAHHLGDHPREMDHHGMVLLVKDLLVTDLRMKQWTDHHVRKWSSVHQLVQLMHLL